jgi:hypothetical protein
LSKAGIKSSPYSDQEKADFLLVDGSQALTPELVDTLKNAVTRTLADGGTVWVWNVTPTSAEALSQVMGYNIKVEPRVASSFVIAQPDALLTRVDNADLYFAEDDDWKQMSYGLSGDFLSGAKILLQACPADWRQWNYQAEPVKTAALYRSELETTSSRTVIVIRPSGNGRILLCNLNPEVDSPKKAAVLACLFRNEGVHIEPIAAQNGFIDLKGRLVRALVCGSFAWTNEEEAYSDTLPPGVIKNGAKLDGRTWKPAAGNNGVFDFKNGLVAGPEENAYAYLAIWIKSPKPLSDLLSEPNLPKLSFTYGADDGCELWLNGNRLATHNRQGPLDPEMFVENPLLLKLGWNQVVIKVVQLDGEWKFAGKFDYSDVSFLSKLEFATQRPAGE